VSNTTNAKLEAAIERALREETGGVDRKIDAAVVARVLTRWHGDNAGEILRLAAELAEAGK
jgi:hypothetical protein